MTKARELADLIANVNHGSSLRSKNFIQNGAQNVAQRATSSTGLGGSSGYFVTDRNKLVFSTSGRLTMEQVADGPSGFLNATKLSCTTADTSINSGEVVAFSQYFEGQNLQSLKKGTSDAVPITVSFYVKANASATYGMEVYDLDNTRSISTTFDVTTGWTRVEKTFAGDTTGALDDDNEGSLAIFIWLHAGSTYNSGTLNTSWNSVTNANRTDSNNTSFFDSTSRTFFITGWQMEIGEKATEFEHINDFGKELAQCQRYYQAENYADHYRATRTTDGNSQIVTKWKKTMRAQPTVTTSFENATPSTPINIHDTWGFTTLNSDETTDYYFNGWTADADL